MTRRGGPVTTRAYGHGVRSRRDASATRDRLRALTRTAYTAAQGHLEVDPAAAEVAPRPRRWRLSARAARAAVVLLVAVGAVAGVRAMASTGSDPVPVQPGWGSAEQVLGEQGPSGQARPEPSSAGADAGEADAEPQDPEPADPEAADAETERAEGEGPSRTVVVHVAGQVAAPGVVDLPAGSRVHHAIAAAGGATSDADLNALNLARPLTDGEQVYVPAPGEAVPMAAGPASEAVAGAPGPTGPVDLNRADSAQLEALPGIGPVLAGRILQWRADHGRFSSVEELGEVTGIGTTLLARLRDLVTV